MLGDEVLYKLIPIEGSIAQNPIGFMFNDANFSRPAYKDIAKYNKTTNQITLEEYQEFIAPEIKEFEKRKMEEKQEYLQAFETGSNVTANENGYTIEDAVGVSEKAIEGYTIPEDNTENFEQADLEEQKPMAKSRVKELLKASQEVKDNKKLENFWDNEINNYSERKEKTGYNSYLDLENAYKEVADDISVEEFIENSVRCKF